jgi:hypothetical protein
MLPESLNHFLQARVSMQRIDRFLSRPEVREGGREGGREGVKGGVPRFYFFDILS